MTVYEHLEYFALTKGIKEEKIKETILFYG